MGTLLSTFHLTVARFLCILPVTLFCACCFTQSTKKQLWCLLVTLCRLTPSRHSSLSPFHSFAFLCSTSFSLFINLFPFVLNSYYTAGSSNIYVRCAFVFLPTVPVILLLGSSKPPLAPVPVDAGKTGQSRHCWPETLIYRHSAASTQLERNTIF